jgi:membrane fusion protein (multidrug efflux system)
LKRSRLAALALAAVTTAACHQEHAHVEAPPKLLVTTPQRRPTEFTREYVAQLRAHQHIEVRALERGYLQGIFVDEGQRVTRGQRMFQLLPVIYQAEVQEAEAEADRAGIEYDNTRALADKNVVSTQELALAGATRAKARAKLKLASAHQSLAHINAPFTGTMGRFQARLGSLIGEGDLLTTLSDASKVWVYFNVSEREYLDLKTESPDLKARPVRLQLANGKLFEQPGTIETIDSDFDNETGTIAFRAGFPNPDGLLRHGETGKILLSSNVPDALLIPQKATFEVLDKKFVFVVDASHHVHSRPITVTAELPQLYVVGSGLTEQDQVLVEGLRRVREGSAIEPDVRPPSEVLQHLDVAAE